MILFIEYEICSTKWEDFLAMIPNIKKEAQEVGVLSHVFLVSTENSFRVVEQLEMLQEENSIKMKELRHSECRWNDIVLGGLERIHFWTFENIL